MEDGSPLWGAMLLVLFIILSGILYGFHAAVQNLNELSLEKPAEDKKKRADRLLHVIKEPGMYVNTILSVVTLLDIIIGIYVFPIIRESAISLITDPGPVITAITDIVVAVCLLLFIMVFGIVIPKYYGACYSEKWAYKLVYVVRAVGMVMFPVVFLVKCISDGIMRIFGQDPDKEYDNVTEEEIVSMVNEGHEQGVILASEAEMINNIIEFGDKKADDIMTHRKAIVAVDSDWTLKDTIKYILEENYSRFPVYREDIDNIIGILHLKDVMRLYDSAEYMDKHLADIPGLYREAVFIPETRNLNVLFKEMQSEKIHMVIVVDEYGQTAGLVAMEDILEEIVGNILDEYDEENVLIAKQEDGSYIMDGMADLQDVGEALGIDFEDEEYDTLNGFLISRLERIPMEGEKPSVTAFGYRFDVQEIRDKVVQSVKVIRLEPEESEEGLLDNEVNEQEKEL